MFTEGHGRNLSNMAAKFQKVGQAFLSASSVADKNVCPTNVTPLCCPQQKYIRVSPC